MLGVERLDAGARGRQDLGVARQRLGGRVAEVAQEGEMDVRIEVAERLHLEVRDQLLRTRSTLSRIVGTITIVPRRLGNRDRGRDAAGAAAE